MARGRFYELSACVAASGERDARPALVLGPGAEDAPVALLDRDVVDARLAAAHVALVVELPLLVAVAAPPLPPGAAAPRGGGWAAAGRGGGGGGGVAVPPQGSWRSA